MQTFAKPNPDKEEVHLPMGMSSDVHNMYMDEVRDGNTDLQPVSDKYFNTVWRERVPHLKVRVFHKCVHLCGGLQSFQKSSVTCSFILVEKQLFWCFLVVVYSFQIIGCVCTFTSQVCHL